MLPLDIVASITEFLGNDVDALLTCCKHYSKILIDEHAFVRWVMKTFGSDNAIYRAYTSSKFFQKHHDRRKLVALLLDAGASPSGWKEAVQFGDDGVLNTLASRGRCDIDTLNEMLCIAIKKGYPTTVKYLIYMGASASFGTRVCIGHCPINVDVIDALLDSSSPKSVLRSAIAKDEFWITEYVMKMNPNSIDNECLMYAIMFGRQDVVKLLLDVCDVTVECVRTAAIMASAHILELLLEKRPEFASDPNTITHLVHLHQTDTMCVIKKHGGVPALMYAARLAVHMMDIEMVCVLTSLGVTHRDILVYAIQMNDASFVKTLLDDDVLYIAADGVMTAVICGSVDIVKILIQYGASCEVVKKYALTFGTPVMIDFANGLDSCDM